MPDEFDFDAAMAAKGLGGDDPAEVTQPEATEATEAVETTETQRQRDDSGRFVKTAETAVETPEGVDSEALILGKFKTNEELQQAYQNLEQQQGRSGNELGDLRAELDQMRQQIEQSGQSEPVSQDAIDQWAEEAPHEAAMWAVQNQQPRVYERVMEAWFEADARNASRFETALAVQRIRTEVSQQIAPTTETVAQERNQRDFNEAWAGVAQKVPDMMQYAETMLETAKTAPELVTALQSGDQASKERLIENLYYLTKGREAGTANQVANDLGRQADQTESNDKIQATVASASSSVAREEGKDGIEEWKKSTFLDEPVTSVWAAMQPKT